MWFHSIFYYKNYLVMRKIYVHSIGKFIGIFKVLMLVLVLVGTSIKGWGQTNPTPQTLPYSQNFNSLTGVTPTYPAGFQGWNITGSLANTYPSTTPSTDRAITVVTNTTAAIHVGDFIGKMGLYSSNASMASICLSIVTTGVTNIQVGFDAMTQRNENSRINELGLQYRVGTTGNFTNVASGTYQNTLLPTNTTGTGSVNILSRISTLPLAAEGQPIVQLRWVIRQVSGSGNNVGFALDNISITGTLANAAPTATAVSIAGTASVGQVLTGNYTYADAESNPQGISTFKWYRADDALGTNEIAISGEVAQTYTLAAADFNKFIRFSVVPVATGGTLTGIETFSSRVGPICVTPTLSSASQAATTICGTGSAVINMTGLVASSTNNTINYTINGVAQPAATGISADASGNASFTTTSLTTANNGQTLQITGITQGACNTVFTQDVTLAVAALPAAPTVPTVTGTNPSCGSTTLNIMVPPAGETYYWQGTTALGTSTTSPTSAAFPVVSTGTYYVRSRNNTTLCWSTASSLLVTINPIPTTNWALSSSNACFNASAQTATLAYTATTGSPNSYSITWNALPANSFATVTNAIFAGTAGGGNITINIPAGTNVGTYTGTITVNNAGGCVSVAVQTFTVTINDLPATTWDATATTLCQSASLQTTPLAYTSTTGTPNTYSITWNALPANSLATVTNAIFAGTSGGGLINISVPANTPAGTYTGNITVRNANACISSPSQTFTVTVNATPTTAWAATATAVCANTNSQTTNLAYTATTNTPTSYSITWSSVFLPVTNVAFAGNAGGGTIPIDVPANAAAATYTGTITTRAANGCVSNSSVFTVLINPTPVATTTNGGPYCVGSTIQLTGNPAGLSSYIWTGPNAFTGSPISQTYTQNFDNLPSAASWTDNVSLLGWYINGTNYLGTDNGASGTGGMRNYGVTGDLNRTLGSLNTGTSTASGSAGLRYAVRLTNTTGFPVTNVNISYKAMQFKNQAATVDKLIVDYQLNAASITAGSWTVIPALDFNSPNSNTLPFSTDISANVTLGTALANGASIWIRWNDFDVTNSDDGLGIDDLTVILSTNVIEIPNATVSMSGTYNLTATNAVGCPATASTVVTVNPNLPASVSIAALPAGTICPGTNITFTASSTNGGAAPVYQWKLNGSNVGTNSTTYASNTLADGDVIEVVMTSNASPCLTGSPAMSSPITITLNTGSIWSGTTSTNWNVATNWLCGNIPTPNDNVTIPAGAPNYPVIGNGQSASCFDISLVTGATVIVSGTGVFNLYGNITNTGGILDLTDGTLRLSEDAPCSGLCPYTFLSGLTIKDKTVKNIIVATIAGLNFTANDTVKVTGKLSFAGSNRVFNTEGNLTLVSNATATASVGDLTNSGVNSGNTINGNVNIERYLFSRRAWRFLATPVVIAGSPTITQSWRENEALGTNTGTGYGTRITGPGSNMDEYTVRGSMKSYNMSTGTFDEVVTSASYANGIANDQGYFVFVRGDRGIQIGGTTGATNLRIKGVIRTGNQTFNVDPGKFQSVGNPYPSAINIKSVIPVAPPAGTISESIIIWNPIAAGANGLGKYETYVSDGFGGDYTQVGNPAIIRNTIQSGEAFFIQAGILGGSITIEEADKVAGSTLVSRNGMNERVGETRPTLDINLYTKDASGAEYLADAVKLNFNNNYSNSIDNYDVRKINNTADNLSIRRNDKVLVVERRADLVATDTLFLNLTSTRIATYRFEIDPSVLGNTGLDAFLKDKFLQTETPVSLTTITNVQFDITADVASRVADRFMIVFKQAASVHFTTISALRNADKTVQIKWGTQQEVGVINYKVQHSNDGINFTNLYTQLPLANNGTNPSYSKQDATATKNNNWYRVKANMVNGTTKYTSVAMVGALLDVFVEPSIAVYPNPVEDKFIKIHFAKNTGKYSMTLLNEVGKTVYTKNMVVISDNETQTIEINKSFAAGNYNLLLVLEDGSKKVLPILIL
jgi:hypothetical protein